MSQSNSTGRCILPLPEAVAAQIKSSTAIVSLSGVVLELLKNSLDAKATRIEAAIDFARGGCTVEDDGLGIPPNEFREEGGLGKLYHTSKYNANEAQLGRNGTFLASLAAMSLLTITSHHNEYRSHNSATFHHSEAVERQLPAPAAKHIQTKHGTRATVRNLFGNLPVRVKQRSAALEQKSEHERLWDTLKRDIAGLLLSWHGTLSLKMRDEEGKAIINFNTSNSPSRNNSGPRDDNKHRSARLTFMLNILTQADYIAVDEWSNWVPVSVSIPAVTIKGAISLDPAPSKHVQFLSLGIRPIVAGHGHNELYDEINRLFSLSSFGSIEDDMDIDELEKTRRRADKRFKNEGYTNRQLKARKDVDRHPMFHLRIAIQDSRPTNLNDDQLDTESTLQNVVEVLEAMVTKWLSAHNFRPQQRRRKRERPGTASSDHSHSVTSSTTSTARPLSTLSQPRTSRPDTAETTSKLGKKKRTKTSGSLHVSARPESRVFAEWSRIKSGKTNFFDRPPAFSSSKDSPASQREVDHSNVFQATSCPTEKIANFDVKTLQQGALSLQAMHATPELFQSEAQSIHGAQDDTILWTDPATKKTYLLYARTGCVVPDLRSRPNTTSSMKGPVLSQQTMNKSLRLPQRPATASTVDTPWLTNVLQSWVNPVFKPSERRIQQVDLHEPEVENSGHSHARHGCSHVDMEKAFSQATADTKPGKLSKYGLQHAEVISQVDQKFILVKIKPQPNPTASNGQVTDLLVLLDQHAADERIQVERLFRELCTPLKIAHGSSLYKSKLGHQAQVASTHLEKPLQYSISQIEATHFATHAARFAIWGILFDIVNSSSTQTATVSKHQAILSVTTLPPAIAERCKADPKVLISLLRSTVWKYVEDPQSHLLPNKNLYTSNVVDEADWVRRLSTCPSKLIDMVNSRACRSAIMFNDELDLEQCRDLVKKLAKCVFPFMCAHGRPSMIPLVDLGGLQGIHSFANTEAAESEKTNFITAWKNWKP